MHTNTHTHTHIERERERERESYNCLGQYKQWRQGIQGLHICYELSPPRFLEHHILSKQGNLYKHIELSDLKIENA